MGSKRMDLKLCELVELFEILLVKLNGIFLRQTPCFYVALYAKGLVKKITRRTSENGAPHVSSINRAERKSIKPEYGKVFLKSCLSLFHGPYNMAREHLTQGKC